MKWSISGISVVLSCVACAQQPSKSVAFEVASIKPAEPSPMGQIRVRMSADAGMLRYTNVSVKDCMRVAYRVKDFQIQGPDWLGGERFDIVAKLPDGSSQDQIPEMLQALLEERFKLKVHRETKEHAIYALVPGKNGPQLKAAEAPPPDAPVGGGNAPGAGVPRGAMRMMMDPAGMHLQAPSATLAAIAESLSRFTERPVVDMTGIQGQYEFDLVFSPETMRNMPARGPMPPPGAGDHPAPDATQERAGSIFDAVQRYGLKLEPRKGSMDVLIVDAINKAPTEN